MKVNVVTGGGKGGDWWLIWELLAVVLGRNRV